MVDRYVAQASEAVSVQAIAGAHLLLYDLLDVLRDLPKPALVPLSQTLSVLIILQLFLVMPNLL